MRIKISPLVSLMPPQPASQKQQPCPSGIEKDKCPVSQRGSGCAGAGSPAPGKTEKNIVLGHPALCNVLVYLDNQPPAQRLEGKHFPGMKEPQSRIYCYPKHYKNFMKHLVTPRPSAG